MRASLDKEKRPPRLWGPTLLSLSGLRTQAPPRGKAGSGPHTHCSFLLAPRGPPHCNRKEPGPGVLSHLESL